MSEIPLRFRAQHAANMVMVTNLVEHFMRDMEHAARAAADSAHEEGFNPFESGMMVELSVIASLAGSCLLGWRALADDQAEKFAKGLITAVTAAVTSDSKNNTAFMLDLKTDEVTQVELDAHGALPKMETKH